MEVILAINTEEIYWVKFLDKVFTKKPENNKNLAFTYRYTYLRMWCLKLIQPHRNNERKEWQRSGVEVKLSLNDWIHHPRSTLSLHLLICELINVLIFLSVRPSSIIWCINTSFSSEFLMSSNYPPEKIQNVWYEFKAS